MKKLHTKLSADTIDTILDEVRMSLEELEFSPRLGCDTDKVAKKAQKLLTHTLYDNDAFITE